MKLLLDTHTLLWWLTGSDRLSDRCRKEIQKGEGIVFASTASIWEMSIKAELGRLTMPSDMRAVLESEGFDELPITVEHAQLAGRVKLSTADPFDRMLTAQAICEGCVLATSDPAIRAYDVPTIW